MNKVIIKLENIRRDFQVGEETVHALRGVSFSITEGEFVTIMGTSGSGKSTLLNLLMAGGMDYGGSILLDDTELRAVAPESLYELMSVIQQNVFVFNASIRDNVTMFRDFPQDRLESAIQHAHLSELLVQLQRQPAKMVLRASYQDGRASNWLRERARIPAVVLPFTVGGDDKAKDLFSLVPPTAMRPGPRPWPWRLAVTP